MNNGHHAKQDQQSLMLHLAAVEMLEADPSLQIKALATLERWDSFVSIRSKSLRDCWVQIIKTKDWDLALEQSERGNQLRQASPLATILPRTVRIAIMQSLQAERKK